MGDSEAGPAVGAEVDTTFPHILRKDPEPQCLELRFTVRADRKGVFLLFGINHRIPPPYRFNHQVYIWYTNPALQVFANMN